MGRLLSANFSGLFHTKRFWLGAVIMAAYGIYDVFNSYIVNTHWEAQVCLEGPVLDVVIIAVSVLAVESVMHIHTDYRDGTIRNKLVVGHSRAGVYLANLAAQYGAGLFYMAVHLIVTLGFGLPLLGNFRQPVEKVFAKLLCSLLVLLSFVSVYILLGMLFANRAAPLVAVCLVFALMLSAAHLSGQLEITEWTDNCGGVIHVKEENGSIGRLFVDKDGRVIQPEDIKPEPNPRYVKEPLRSLCGLILDISPGGQAIQLAGNTDRQSPLWMLSINALAVAFAVTAAGIMAFQRKDIN